MKSNPSEEQRPARKGVRAGGVDGRSPGRVSAVERAVWMVVLCGLAAVFGSPARAAEPDLRRSAVVRAVERVSPAVVNIATVVRERVRPGFPFAGDDFFRDFFPDLFRREYTRNSLGSGVIIDGREGHVITNHHVVSRATEIKVVTAGREEFQARILGTDPRSDLAVLQIDAEEPLPEIGMGDSDDLMIGETVIAIGNPFGLSHTVTTGVVSAVDRTVRSGNVVYSHFIQTDASINPGNSGGPLLNINGDLIGINTAIYQKAQGIGFAIPVNKARRIVQELIRAGEVRFPWIGLEIQELSGDLRAHFELPRERDGVLIRDVYESSPASRASIRRGDILLSIGREPVGSPADYRTALAEYIPGNRVVLELFRGGATREVRVVLAAFPPDLALTLVAQKMGIEVENAGRRLAREYGLSSALAIREVRRGSEAARSGLEPGDLIVKVNEMETPDVASFEKAISRYHQLPSLTLFVRRGPIVYTLTLPF